MRSIIICCLVCLPLKSLRLTSPFGYRVHPITGKYAFHSGIDLRAKHDTVFAVMDGQVTTTGFNSFLGIYIELDHGSFQSEYGHLSQVFVAAGDTIATGEPIGITGATGRVTGEHLHFGVRYGNRYVDPLKFLYQLLIIKNHE